MRDYNIYKLIASVDIDVISGIEKCGSKRRYFEAMESFVNNAPDYIENIPFDSMNRNNKAILENFSKLALLLQNINAEPAQRKVERLISAILEQEAEQISKNYAFVENECRKIWQAANSAEIEPTIRPAKTQKSEDTLALASEDKKNILAVDDMPVVLNTIKGILEKDYKFYGAINRKTALEILYRTDIDLILLDIEMPELDGFGMMTVIRRMVDYKETPILFVTSNTSPQYIMQAMKSGASDYIRKPIEPDVLLEKVAKHI